jgi:micrococcal nuclease
MNAPQPEPQVEECYGIRAASDVRALLSGQTVFYTLGTPDRDIFDRALAYVWLPNGEFVNETIIERGDAKVLISQPNPVYSSRFQAAAVRTASANRGLWGACVDS